MLLVLLYPHRVHIRYCGHGAGQQYFKESLLRDATCHATALLMGCSSGRLRERGVCDVRAVCVALVYPRVIVWCATGVFWCTWVLSGFSVSSTH